MGVDLSSVMCWRQASCIQTTAPRKIKVADFELTKKLGHLISYSLVYAQSPVAPPAELDLEARCIAGKSLKEL